MSTDAPVEGYPATIALPELADGPLLLSFRDGTRAEFEVTAGRVSASTRARATMLLELGGRLLEDEPAVEDEPTDTPPTGSGNKSRATRGSK